MVVTDHNPSLTHIAWTRLKTLAVCKRGSWITISLLKGASNGAADAFSRHPHQQTADGDDLAEYETDTHHSQAALCQGLSIAQIRVSTLLPSQQENLHLQELRDHAEQDQAYQALKLVITEGFPSIKASLPDSLTRFWSIRTTSASMMI